MGYLLTEDDSIGLFRLPRGPERLGTALKLATSLAVELGRFDTGSLDKLALPILVLNEYTTRTPLEVRAMAGLVAGYGQVRGLELPELSDAAVRIVNGLTRDRTSKPNPVVDHLAGLEMSLAEEHLETLYADRWPHSFYMIVQAIIDDSLEMMRYSTIEYINIGVERSANVDRPYLVRHWWLLMWMVFYEIRPTGGPPRNSTFDSLLNDLGGHFGRTPGEQRRELATRLNRLQVLKMVTVDPRKSNAYLITRRGLDFLQKVAKPLPERGLMSHAA